MNSYQLALQHAALMAAHEGQRVYVVRSGGEFEVVTRFPVGSACVEVLPSGETREIAGPGPRTTFGPGKWEGD